MKVVKIGLLTLVLLSSCEHKDLCYDHDRHGPHRYVDMRIVYDLRWEYPEYGPTAPNWETQWSEEFGMDYEDLNPLRPEGVRVLEYNTETGSRISNFPAEGGRIGFTHTAYAMIAFNNDTEYILFENLDEPNSSLATTRAARIDDITVNQPDVLYCSFLRNDLDDNIILNMTPVTYVYLIRCKFEHGAEYLALARGELGGMAPYCYLNDGSTPDESVAMFFNGTVKPWGVEVVMNTFGAPGYPANYRNREYFLNLEVRLKNGDYKSFKVDVTPQLREQPRGGVIEVDGLIVSDAEGANKGGGFNVEVEGWGEYEKIILPLERK